MLWSCCQFANANADFYKGQWEFEINYQLESKPINPQLKRIEYCVTRIDELLSLFKTDPSCEISNIKLGVDSVTWQQSCSAYSGTYIGDATLARRGTDMSGKLIMRAVVPGLSKTINTTYRIDGRYKGDCTK